MALKAEGKETFCECEYTWFDFDNTIPSWWFSLFQIVDTILIFQLNRANHSYVTKSSMFPLGTAFFNLFIIYQGRLAFVDSFKRCFTLEIKMTNEHLIKDRLLSHP